MGNSTSINSSSSASSTATGPNGLAQSSSEEESSKPPPSRCSSLRKNNCAPSSSGSSTITTAPTNIEYISIDSCASESKKFETGIYKGKLLTKSPSEVEYLSYFTNTYVDDQDHEPRGKFKSVVDSTTTENSSLSSDFSDDSLISTPNSIHSQSGLDSSDNKLLNEQRFISKSSTIATSISTSSVNSIRKKKPKSTTDVTSVNVTAAAVTVSSTSTGTSSATLTRWNNSSANIEKLYNPKFNKKIVNHHEVDIDSVIEKLIEIGLTKSYSSNSLVIDKKEINFILAKSKEVFAAQPTLLELSAPIKVVGDLHGQFNDLLRVLKLSGFPPHSNYLFLGDYVDRGKQSLETILLLLCFKIKYPNNFFMLRGNHESGNICKIYGFYDEVKRRLGSVKIWKNFVDVFNVLPIAAIISDKIFCVHGGLSPSLKSMSQINKIKRPTDIPDVGLLSDLLWSDPSSKVGDWSPNDRGISYFYSKKNVNDFLSKFNFDLIVRGHMVVEDGYEFFNKKRLVTVFSAPNYCGEFNNWGAVMNINKNLLCSFELLKPVDIKRSKKKK